MKTQVNREHYKFETYVTKARWCSYWHQIDELAKLKPATILEVGVGAGFFSRLGQYLGFHIETVDVAEDLMPDHLGSVTDLPFSEDQFDMSCAFQVLEHLPWSDFPQALSEMARVSRKYIVLSLPEFLPPRWSYSFHVPKVGTKSFSFKKPFYKVPVHEFDGEHYWEIGKSDFPLERIESVILTCGLKIIKNYTIQEKLHENMGHRFFVLEKP